ncbi:uncharacterized protein METZ01_LOCUS514684, partial [marine metagenome]
SPIHLLEADSKWYEQRELELLNLKSRIA